MSRDHERVDRSGAEREAEGGMRASEPGHVGDQRVEDLIEEANDLEGHMVQGAHAREGAPSHEGLVPGSGKSATISEEDWDELHIEKPGDLIGKGQDAKPIKPAGKKSDARRGESPGERRMRGERDKERER